MESNLNTLSNFMFSQMQRMELLEVIISALILVSFRNVSITFIFSYDQTPWNFVVLFHISFFLFKMHRIMLTFLRIGPAKLYSLLQRLKKLELFCICHLNWLASSDQRGLIIGRKQLQIRSMESLIFFQQHGISWFSNQKVLAFLKF
jgi:hypothetical protein